MRNEIERKFLVSEAPEFLKNLNCNSILQGYLCADSDGNEIRLRRKGEKHYLTVKRGSGRIREETEVDISNRQFELLWHLTAGRRVEKKRYEIEYSEHIIELDIYKGNLSGLRTAEVEFTSQEDAESFSPPDWFGKEITENTGYSNRNLAVNGLPGRSPLK
jgi:adenylate cyclase